MRQTLIEPLRSRRRVAIGAISLLGAALLWSAAPAQTTADIMNTKHNLSVSGPGTTRATSETRICVFCHTPHNATPSSPLWNKELEPQVYAVYSSPTLRAEPIPQPFGATKLCLSCHDGTIAMGTVVNPYGGITMAGDNTLPPGSLSNFGLDLSGHHPVSFAYSASLPNPELEGSPPDDLVYGGTDEIHCITCHDPHKDLYGRFLVKDNRYSALCTTCHRIPAWPASAHATSTEAVAGILPRPPKTWPNYAQLDEWGCEACHTPHFARTPQGLLDFSYETPPASCTTDGCHGAPVAPHVVAGTRSSLQAVDIGRQVRKVSAHHETIAPAQAGAQGIGPPPEAVIGVACSGCHNPHVASPQPATPPYASGLVRGVNGIDRNGGLVAEATYEYEICFKCHAEASTDIDYVPRVVGGTNTRLAFALENPSYHPVVGIGRNPAVPSIPSSFEPQMTTSDFIYCTSCHADDAGGSRGPHGSSFRPILKARYEVDDFTAESFDAYALCYRCHDRESILRNDSFRRKTQNQTPTGGGHSGHLAARIPCSACHDPHGVADSGMGPTGSHTKLINFDLRLVAAKPGNAYPVFDDTGGFSGSCTLVCHGVTHDNLSYP